MRYQFALAVLCSAAALEVAVLAQEAIPDVREYVRGLPIYADSVDGPGSYSEMKALYDSSVVPDLIEMLNSDAEEMYWARIAGMLGVVGDEQAVEALIAFVEKPVVEARLSQAHHDARRSAITALGYLTSSTGSERALSYLIGGLTPNVWRQRNVQGVAPWATSYQENDRLLSEYALYGLAFSGNPRAGQALRSLQQSPTAEQARFRNGLDSTLKQWLEVYDLVAERGVAGMHEHYKAQRELEDQRRLEEIERLGGPEARRAREAQ